MQIDTIVGLEKVSLQAACNDAMLSSTHRPLAELPPTAKVWATELCVTDRPTNAESMTCCFMWGSARRLRPALATMTQFGFLKMS